MNFLWLIKTESYEKGMLLSVLFNIISKGILFLLTILVARFFGSDFNASRDAVRARGGGDLNGVACGFVMFDRLRQVDGLRVWRHAHRFNRRRGFNAGEQRHQEQNVN